MMVVGITGTHQPLKPSRVAGKGGTIWRFKKCAFGLKESPKMRVEKGQPASKLMTSADDVAKVAKKAGVAKVAGMAQFEGRRKIKRGHTYMMALVEGVVNSG